MIFLGPISSIFDYLTYAILYYGFGANTEAGSSLFHTGWFVESILTQTLIIHIIRTNKIPFLQSRASWPLIFTTLLIAAIGVWLPGSAFAHGLGFTPLPWIYWPITAVIIVSYLTLAHLMKNWFIHKFGWS
jgi:Mg2+-importing ATPase